VQAPIRAASGCRDATGGRRLRVRAPRDDASEAQDDGGTRHIQEQFVHAYDPRVTWLEDGYWVSWCNSYNGHGPTFGLGWFMDFGSFTQGENAFLPFNRNGVLFPRRIGGAYGMYNRPSDNGHTPFGEIYSWESPDMVPWGRHRHVMAPIAWTWQSTKIGAGPKPIETDKGWLLLYHGVLTSCSGFVYSMGVALLDLDEPWKVIARSGDDVLGPHAPYEQVGDVQNVFFPCAALTEGDRISVLYGAADTVTGLAHGHISDLIPFARER
jgi:beta-1,4-mannooligosaccharide/beta-1,4-mannosyl-N-acetylglucosamine phosphorylase